MCSSIQAFTLHVTVNVFKDLETRFYRKWFKIDPNDSKGKKFIKGVGNFFKQVMLAVAIAVSLLAIGIFLFIDLAIIAPIQACQKRRDDCFQLLNSEVFEKYATSLKDFVETELKKVEEAGEGEVAAVYSQLTAEVVEEKTILLGYVRGMITRITSHTPSKKGSTNKDFHQDVIKSWRLALSISPDPTKPGDVQAHAFLTAFAQWKYAGVDLWAEMSSFVSHKRVGVEGDVAKLPGTMADYKDTVVGLIKDSYATIKAKKSIFTSVFCSAAEYFDPHMLGDPPTTLEGFVLDNGSNTPTQMIRTACVTKDVQRSCLRRLLRSEVVPEFKHYLKDLKAKGECHLAVNLMKRKGHEERVRTKATENLENDPECKDGVVVVTLDKDSSFYWQKGHFGQKSVATGAFKEQFMGRLFAKGGSKHYYWSKRLIEAQWKARCGEIIDHVQNTYFNGKTELTREERLDFIEITYVEIIKDLVQQFKPKTCNTSCKSCIDRGASTLSLLYNDFIMQKAKANEADFSMAESVKKMLSLTFAPALLAMNRPILSCRVPRLASAVSTMAAVH